MKEVKFKRFSAKATAPKRKALSSAGYNLFQPKIYYWFALYCHCIDQYQYEI